MTEPPATLRRPRRLEHKQASELVGTPAPELEPTLTDAAIVRDADTDEPVLAYLPLPRTTTAALREAALHTPGLNKPGGIKRDQRIESASRTFGYSPRRAVRGRDGCHAYALTHEAPAVNRVLQGCADVVADTLAAQLPEVADTAHQVVDTQVHPDWRMGSWQLWTSGVVNRTSQLPYHRDHGNFRVWSGMPVLRRNVRGGHLHLPEYQLTVACRDGWAVYFAGWELVHGVTPMRATRADGYRYSIVYYALAGMRNCAELALETVLTRQRRTLREREMAARLAQGERDIPNRLGHVPARRR